MKKKGIIIFNVQHSHQVVKILHKKKNPWNLEHFNKYSSPMSLMPQEKGISKSFSTHSLQV